MKRKNIQTCIAIAALALGLAACGGGNASSAGTANPDRLNTNYDKALPVETQLVLGTLKLEGTPQGVDPAMAAELLPLYTLLQQMTASGTAAQAEIDAVLEQIQATMTTDQIHAIAEMKLTQTAMADYFGAGRFSASGTRTPGASGGGNGPDGGFLIEGGGPPAGFEGGAPPAGFEGGPGGGGAGASGNGGSGLNQNQIATLRAQRTGTPGFQGSGTPSFLINQLIQLLEKKAQSLTPTI